MVMLLGNSMKRAETLNNEGETKWNTENHLQTIPSVPLTEKKIKILVVDDDEPMRRVTSRHIGNMGFDVIEACNGYMGQNLFLNTSINLVVTDLEMPVMDGWALAFNIKQEAPHIPIIMVTGMDKERFMQNKKENCIDVVMFKPFKMKELGQNIKRMLGQYVD